MAHTWQQQVVMALVKFYGVKRAGKAAPVLVNAIFGDFRKMLDKAATGELIKEKYHTEDKKTFLLVEGEKLVLEGKTLYVVRQLHIGEQSINFSNVVAGETGLVI